MAEPIKMQFGMSS